MKRDDCGDLNIFGKRGDIYQYGSGLFGVTILHAPTAQHWNIYRAKLAAAGCRISQNGDSEGTAVFDPGNEQQSRLAIEAIRAKRKKRITPVQAEALRKGREKSLDKRPSFALETHFEVSAMANPPAHAEDVFLR